MSKSYELSLPVFKQGDDLAHQIEQHKTLTEAFEAQAACYDEAAKMCRRMAGVAAEMPELKVEAGTHVIYVSGPAARMEQLAREDLLSVFENEEDEEEDGEDEEDGDGEEENGEDE